ncbi:MAG: nucleotidyltransferase [Methanomicrobiales archaeon HGW-Methanomicrobiales-4]|nr:MAG: nucleotidyltransferase [Methanomicrobiales archaeon HGW-Methanomicrobiales-4]
MPLQGQQYSNPILIITKNSLPDIQRKYGVKKIGIFGSYARNEQSSDSDVDVLVEFKNGEATFDNFMQLASYLEEIFSRHVDLLTCGGISKHIRPYIEKEVIWIER